MSIPKRKIGRFLKISVIIALLASVVLIFRSLVTKKPVLDIDLNFLDFRHKLGHIYINSDSFTFSKDNDKTSYLSISFTSELDGPPDFGCDTKDSNSLCLKWIHRGKLEIKETISQSARCYNIVWTPKNNGFTPQDCVSITRAHWYGGSAHLGQQWPLEDMIVPMQPYISSPLKTSRALGHETFGPVLERYWFNSEGVGIYVENSVPLHVSINETKPFTMCLKSSFTASPYQNPENLPPVLRYFVCKADNAKDIHQYMYKKCFQTPSSVPAQSRMKYPTWTSGRFQDRVSQSDVLLYTNKISTNNFPKGFFEIYGKYFRLYGDYNFNDETFPNSHQMISEIKSSGFEVGIWVTPYMDLHTLNTAKGKRNSYYVINEESNLPAKIPWNGNQSLFIDFTNKNANIWYLTILKDIQKDFMNSAFIFDGGEASIFDLSMSTSTFIHNPCEYTSRYVQFAHSLGDVGTVKVGYQTQKYPLYIEITDRESSWDYDGGLKSIIPTVLTYGLLGYPFINPGPIGGRSVFNRKPVVNETFVENIVPNSELYIRWMLLATYLPIMQFSVPPWEYNENMTKLAKELLVEHENKVYPILIAAAKEAATTGMPIIRPVWWMSPEDRVAQRIDCEFLVGDDLLVAPVLYKKERSRHIYLPSGSRWRDNLRHTHLDGGQWLKNYKVDLKEIATFDRVKVPL